MLAVIALSAFGMDTEGMEQAVTKHGSSRVWLGIPHTSSCDSGPCLLHVTPAILELHVPPSLPFHCSNTHPQ